VSDESSSAPVGVVGRLDAFDARADRLLEPLRRVAALGGCSETQSRGRLQPRVAARRFTYAVAVERDVLAYLWFAGLVALESLVVNQG
jgi:hypothetical protein